MAAFDSHASAEKARQKLPLKLLMEQHGDGGPPPRCPSCQAIGLIELKKGGMISDWSIEDVKQRTDIVQVIGERVKLEKAGASFKGLCPFHKEKTPSFNVVPKKNFFHCFGCHKNGNVFQWLQEIEGLTFIQAVERMAERTGAQLRYEGHERTLFRCGNPDAICKLPEEGVDEVGYLQVKLGLERGEAFKVWLREAGVWREQERLSPSILPGQRARRRKAPEEEVQSSKSKVQEEVQSPKSKVLPENAELPTLVTQDDSADRNNEAAPGGDAGSGLPADQAPPAQAGGAAVEPESAESKSKGRSKKSKKSKGADGDDDAVGGGGGPGGGGGGGDEEGDDGSAAPLEALRWFYQQLTLIEKDERMLWFKRGITPATARIYGLKSNQRSNLQILERMTTLFDDEVLVASGLFVSPKEHEEFGGGGDGPKPNRQYYGWGMMGKKKKTEYHRDDPEWKKYNWGWIDPVLIPYFNARGELIYLRPHKGQMRGGIPQVFFLRKMGVADLTEGRIDALITEGELKAMAVGQALESEGTNGKVKSSTRICALPGVTMAKNWYVRFELVEWVQENGIFNSVVCYDNEEKGDPNLPGFTKDIWNRFDAVAWARFLAGKVLQNEVVKSKVATLPAEWRDEKGKADWDGALVKLVKEVQSSKFKVQSLDEIAKLTREEFEVYVESIWAMARETARQKFNEVIKSARPVGELWQQGLFDREEEKEIHKKLRWISREPELPCGTDQERLIANRILQYIKEFKDLSEDDMPPFVRPQLRNLANMYRELDGRYYECKALTEVPLKRWSKVRNQAWNNREDRRLKHLAWCCDLMLKGLPQSVSDFYLKVHHAVVTRLGGQSERKLLVEMTNVHGETSEICELDSVALSTATRFREWFGRKIGGAWNAGQNPLDALHADLNFAAALKEVRLVTNFGWFPEAKARFFKDLAMVSDGREITPNEKGIFWIDGKGYKLAEMDVEGEPFAMISDNPSPLMHPDRKITDVEVSHLFEEICVRLCETLGGVEGLLPLGIILANGAAEEIYERYTAFPGLWIHGEPESGKSSLARWLMAIWAFMIESGVVLDRSTPAGVASAMNEFGSLPVWLEEFQPTLEPKILEIIKNSFDRASGKKITFGRVPRRIIASVIVTGVATSPEPQVRSRYAHVQASQSKWVGHHFHWFQKSRKDFFFIGRHLLRKRTAFAEILMDMLEKWMEAPELQVVDQRARLCHGVAYAAIVAAAHVFEAGRVVEMERDFREFLRGHCAKAATEVKGEVNVELFFQHIMTCFQKDVFGETPPEVRRYFAVRVKRMEHAPLCPNQTMNNKGWKSYELCILPNPVISLIQEELRRSGKTYVLERSDLRAQMSTRDFWVTSDSKTGQVKQKFGGGVAQHCFCVALDRLPVFGYNLQTDEEYEEERLAAGMDFDHPGKGPLYELCQFIEEKEPTFGSGK